MHTVLPDAPSDPVIRKALKQTRFLFYLTIPLLMVLALAALLCLRILEVKHTAEGVVCVPLAVTGICTVIGICFGYIGGYYYGRKDKEAKRARMEASGEVRG